MYDEQCREVHHATDMHNTPNAWLFRSLLCSCASHFAQLLTLSLKLIRAPLGETFSSAKKAKRCCTPSVAFSNEVVPSYRLHRRFWGVISIQSALTASRTFPSIQKEVHREGTITLSACLFRQEWQETHFSTWLLLQYGFHMLVLWFLILKQ